MYNCELCNYSSIKKSNFFKHLKTKKHLNNEKKEDVKTLKSSILPHKTSENLTNVREVPHKTSQNLTNLEKKNICEFCGKNFKRKDNLKRHLKKYCKEKKNKNTNDFLLKELEETRREKDKLYDYIEKLIEKSGNTYNIENTQNNQIVLNNFGSEDISHITDKFMEKILNIPYVSVQKLIEKVHFSNKKPENKNIALTNKKEKMIKIFKNNKWKYKSKDEIMDEIINTNYTRIDDFYSEKGKNKLDNFHNKTYLKFQEKFEENEEELHEKIKNDCEMLLLSDNL